ncbi:hypothetical protein AB4Y30_09380 [Ornithinibacillus sp. 4-3]|uniref:Uncharacterized protein n=1 Tax=Ornithinibacillus sp. 4-3 TaxID=3231488 RepID=A0AB39HLY0_9BACI
MDTDKNKSEDQATQLKKLVNELNNDVPTDNQQIQIDSNALFRETNEDPIIDILNLPPRKEVHQENTKRARLKMMGRPLSRFIFVCVILVLILGVAYYFWNDELMNLFTL